jgi:hypothetical protein
MRWRIDTPGILYGLVDMLFASIPTTRHHNAGVMTTAPISTAPHAPLYAMGQFIHNSYLRVISPHHFPQFDGMCFDKGFIVENSPMAGPRFQKATSLGSN